ncbi:MAG: TPM domain-containing protein [Byssovorax sp.]
MSALAALRAAARSRARAPGRAALRRLAALFALALALLAPRLGLAAFTPPPLDGHVLDQSGKLSAEDVRRLDGKLDKIRRETGFAIVVFLPASLGAETIDDVAYEAFNAWGIGQKGADNGVLLVIATAERKVRIETGKGVGGALTDLQSNDIIRNDIAPLLQAERYAEAVDRGTSKIAEALVGGTPPGERAPPDGAAPAPMEPINLVIGAVALLLVIILAIVSPGFRMVLWSLLYMSLRGGGGGGGGGGGSGYGGGGGRSGGGGSSDSY